MNTRATAEHEQHNLTVISAWWHSPLVWQSLTGVINPLAQEATMLATACGPPRLRHAWHGMTMFNARGVLYQGVQLGLGG